MTTASCVTPLQRASAMASRIDRGVLASGTEIGNYVIVRELAEGGMGTIYEATHRLLPRRAAIKVLHLHLLDAWSSSSDRLLQEAGILETVRHPGVVRIYDAGRLPDGRPWLAMELLDGITLADRLDRRGRLDPLELVEMLLQLLDALGAAHQVGVVHRDLKPENIILTRRGDGPPTVTLIDWGVAWVAERRERLTAAGMTPGTPDYMSPEQARGYPLDGRSDIYALGVIACEVLCGELPFTGDSPVEIVVQHLTRPPPKLCALRADVPVRLEAIVLQMLAKEPELRPSLARLRASLAELALELQAEDSQELILIPDDYAEAKLTLSIEHDDGRTIVLEQRLGS